MVLILFARPSIRIHQQTRGGEQNIKRINKASGTASCSANSRKQKSSSDQSEELTICWKILIG
jgi:hypothetical protein